MVSQSYVGRDGEGQKNNGRTPGARPLLEVGQITCRRSPRSLQIE